MKKSLDSYTILCVYSYMRNRGNMKNLKNFTTTKSTYNTSNNYSSFWLGDDWDNNGSLFDDEDVKPKTDRPA